jgi:hypothetical protein
LIPFDQAEGPPAKTTASLLEGSRQALTVITAHSSIEECKMDGSHHPVLNDHPQVDIGGLRSEWKNISGSGNCGTPERRSPGKTSVAGSLIVGKTEPLPRTFRCVTHTEPSLCTRDSHCSLQLACDCTRGWMWAGRIVVDAFYGYTMTKKIKVENTARPHLVFLIVIVRILIPSKVTLKLVTS